MFYVVDSVMSFFAPTVQPIQKKVFPEHYYHPIYGLQSKVDTPHIPLNFTYFKVPPKYVFQISGGGSVDLDNHFVQKDVYKKAWMNRKRNSWYDTDRQPTQISSYRNPVIVAKEGNYLSGKKINSREKRYKSSTWYGTLKSTSGNKDVSNAYQEARERQCCSTYG